VGKYLKPVGSLTIMNSATRLRLLLVNGASDSQSGQLEDHEVLVIGDTPLDIRCARAIRAKVLVVATGGATLSEHKLHSPDWAVENLTGIKPELLFDNAFRHF
jgi:phosphoglycolate phosphatase-like HAD superfamily hydrolase